LPIPQDDPPPIPSMAPPPSRILIVDPDSPGAQSLATLAKEHDFDPHHVDSPESALDFLKNTPHVTDAVITEQVFEPSSMSGLKLVSHLHSKFPRLPVIMLTGSGNSNTIIEATKAGAYDCLLKPPNNEHLAQVLEEAVRSARMMSKPVEIGQLYDDQDTIIGRSPAMTEIYKELGRVASKPVTVLIRGETGTGKELFARAIYQHGHRAHRPFVPINCAAIPDNLLESELFGHEKGAFTGADKLRVGKFEQAHSGTLFLDEIGDLSLPLQAKLLRVLQDRQIQRLGSGANIPVDVRIIAATHQNLEKMVDTGTFRADLFYRLNVVSLTIPPLRDRIEDIAPLVRYFLSRYAHEFDVDPPALLPEALQFLELQDWPGNVRQLQNVVWKALLLSRGYAIDWQNLRQIITESELNASGNTSPNTPNLKQLVQDALARAADGSIDAAYPFLIEKLERELFAAVIKKTNGNQAKAARWLGISRLTMREKLHRYHLHPSDADPPAED
ncbi:MAG: sigma-54 dependent transcriptional regulator, partial [Verrucomicrobiota bacterium]